MKKLAIFLVFAGALSTGYAQQTESSLEELYAKANERLEEGAYKNAVLDYNQLVNSNFNDGKIYLNRGIAHYHLGEFDLASKDFDQAFRQQMRDPGLIGYRGMTKYMLKDYAGATTDLEQAAMQGFSNKDGLYMLGNLKFQSGRYAEAVKYYDLAAAKGLQTAVLFNNRGKALLEQGMTEKSIADFDAAIKVDRDFTMAYRNRGTAYLKIQNWESAVSDFARILDQGDASDLFNQGYAYLQLQKYDEAISAIQRAAAKDYGNEKTDPLLAEAFYGSKDFKKAAVYFDKMVRRDGGDLDAWEKLGISLYRDGQFAQADKSLSEAIDRGQTTKETYGYRGMSRFQLKKTDEAFEDLSRVSTMGFTNEDAYYFLGLMLIDKDQYETAIAQLNKGIALNPKKCGAFEARARAYSAMGEYDLAIADIKKAIQLQESGALWVTSASIQMAGKKYERAIQDYDKALQLGMTDAGIYQDQGEAYLQLGNFSEGREKFASALKQDPRRESLYLKIAACDFKLGEYEKAYNSFKKAESIQQIDKSLLYAYGFSAFQKKDYAKTVSLLGNVSEKGSPVETARMLAISHYEMKQYEQAFAAAERATPDAELYLIRGMSAYHLNRIGEAIPFLEKCEKNEQIAGILAKAYLSEGKNELAEKNYTWLIENGFASEGNLLARAGIRKNINQAGALSDLDKVLAINSNSIEALFMRSAIHFENKEWKEALPDLMKLDAGGHKPAQVKYELGITQLETGNITEGRKSLEGALESGSREHRMFAELGRFSFGDGAWDKAIDLLSRALETKEDISLYSVRGRAYFEKESYEKAVQDLTRVEAQSFEELNALGRSYYALDDHQNASENLAAAFSMKREEQELPFILGNSYFRLKEYRQAIDSYLKAVANGYNDAVLFNNLGKAYEQNDAIQDAISAYNKAIDLDPSYERARENRGVALYLNGNYAGAIDDLSRISEKDERVNFYLAESYYKTGKYKEALGYYNKAIDSGKKDGETYHHRARTYLELDQISAALADINLAIQAGEKGAQVYLDRARANIYLGDQRAAMTDLNEAIAKDENNTDAYYNRGYLRELGENYQEAISDYQKVISLDPQDHKAYYSLANSMVSVGNVGGALEPIESAIRIKGDEPAYYKVRGNIFYRIEREEEACENWKKAVELGDKKSSFYLDQYCK